MERGGDKDGEGSKGAKTLSANSPGETWELSGPNSQKVFLSHIFRHSTYQRDRNTFLKIGPLCSHVSEEQNMGDCGL